MPTSKDKFLAEILMEWISPERLPPGDIERHWYHDKEGRRTQIFSEWRPSCDLSQALGDGGLGTVWGQMRNQLFSVRLRFWQELQEILSAPTRRPGQSHLISWPDAFWDINPSAIVDAACKTIGMED